MKLAAPTTLAALLLASLTTACARSEASTATTPAAPPPAAAAPAPLPSHAAARTRLVFFMNPNGRPCQMQDQILLGLGGELAGQVEVVRYRTTEPAELAQFDAYGIRSLPQLVLTDGDGRELRRATPGILGPDQVRALIGR